jgi:hypothetical protein
VHAGEQARTTMRCTAAGASRGPPPFATSARCSLANAPRMSHSTSYWAYDRSASAVLVVMSMRTWSSSSADVCARAGYQLASRLYDRVGVQTRQARAGAPMWGRTGLMDAFIPSRVARRPTAGPARRSDVGAVATYSMSGGIISSTRNASALRQSAAGGKFRATRTTNGACSYASAWPTSAIHTPKQSRQDIPAM